MKELGRRLALVAASLVVSFLGGEVVVRTVGAPPETVTVEAKAVTAQPSHPEQGGVYVATAAGRRLRPNLRATISNHSVSGRKVVIETNRLGYRNPELGTKSGTRVLFLGDSITFGDYLPEEETFVRLVEDLATFGGYSWETVNGAVGGVSLENELAILKETGLAVNPDAVVLGYYLNDFRESPGHYLPKVPWPFAQSRLARLAATAGRRFGIVAEQTLRSDRVDAWKAAFARDVVLSPNPSKGARADFDAQVLESFDDWGGAWSPHSWEATRPLFEELADLAAIEGFQLFFLIFPVRQQVEAPDLYDEPQRKMKVLAAELQVHLLDLLPVLRDEQRASGEQLFYDHCHHTPHANRVIAAHVYSFLKQHFDAQ